MFASSHVYPENPEWTQVIVGSMNMNMNMNTEWLLSRQESYPILGVFWSE